MQEAALIELISAGTSRGPDVLVGIGDDAAVVAGMDPVVAAHDMLVEDVHFRWGTASPADVGHRALAVNLSDLAAMGARPVAALVGLCVGPGVEEAAVAAMYAAMEALGARWGCSVVGGDISTGAVTMAGVTVLGRMPPGLVPVLRSGGRPGDLVCVTGTLGASAAGLAVLEGRVPAPAAGAEGLRAAHRRPEPRVAAGEALARAGATAMLDCSDGLALDLDRLARASGAGAALELDRVPVAAGVDEVAGHLGEDPAVLAATGGEDYELIVSLPPSRIGEARAGLDVPLTVVGSLTGGPAGVAVSRGGRPVTLGRLGWEHRA